jgi:hypothetical protein
MEMDYIESLPFEQTTQLPGYEDAEGHDCEGTVLGDLYRTSQPDNVIVGPWLVISI